MSRQLKTVMDHDRNNVLLMANMAVQQGYRRVFVPASDAPEASLVQGVEVYPVSDLAALVNHLNGTQAIAKQEGYSGVEFNHEAAYAVAFEDVKGQEIVKRALEVACAGGIMYSSWGRKPKATLRHKAHVV